MTYDALRAFADSWGLAAMTAVFVIVVLYSLRPGARKTHDDAARAPFRHDQGPVDTTGEETDHHGRA